MNKIKLAAIVSLGVFILSASAYTLLDPNENNEELSKIQLFTDNGIFIDDVPDSCTIEMIQHLITNSNIKSDAKDFGLAVVWYTVPNNAETFTPCIKELDEIIYKKNNELKK